MKKYHPFWFGRYTIKMVNWSKNVDKISGYQVYFWITIHRSQGVAKIGKTSRTMNQRIKEYCRYHTIDPKKTLKIATIRVDSEEAADYLEEEFKEILKDYPFDKCQMESVEQFQLMPSLIYFVNMGRKRYPSSFYLHPNYIEMVGSVRSARRYSNPRSKQQDMLDDMEKIPGFGKLTKSLLGFTSVELRKSLYEIPDDFPKPSYEYLGTKPRKELIKYHNDNESIKTPSRSVHKKISTWRVYASIDDYLKKSADNDHQPPLGDFNGGSFSVPKKGNLLSYRKSTYQRHPKPKKSIHSYCFNGK